MERGGGERPVSEMWVRSRLQGPVGRCGLDPDPAASFQMKKKKLNKSTINKNELKIDPRLNVKLLNYKMCVDGGTQACLDLGGRWE